MQQLWLMTSVVLNGYEVTTVSVGLGDFLKQAVVLKIDKLL